MAVVDRRVVCCGVAELASEWSQLSERAVSYCGESLFLAMILVVVFHQVWTLVVGDSSSSSSSAGGWPYYWNADTGGSLWEPPTRGWLERVRCENATATGTGVCVVSCVWCRVSGVCACVLGGGAGGERESGGS